MIFVASAQQKDAVHGTKIMTDATIAQPVAENAQQPSAAAQMPSRKSQLPRFNYRTMTCFEENQIRNIQILARKAGTNNDSAVVRMAVDLLSFVNNLPTSSDPSIYLNNFLVLTNNQGDPQNGR
jgi:hypothetical protein